MTADEAVVAVIDALDRAGVPYMLVGSLASNVHGVPRSTRDADFVVALDAGGLARFGETLPRTLPLDSQGGFEAVTGTRRFIVRPERSPFLCELFVLGDDPHDQARFARRTRVDLQGRSLWIASAEDTVITKLRWAEGAARAKDRDDVRNILAVRATELDWDYITRWVTEHGTAALLAEIRRSLPPSSPPTV